MSFEVNDVVLGAVVLGIVEIAKYTGLPKRFAPLASLVVGVAGVFLALPESTIGLSIVHGLVLGLTASGFYSQAKTLTGN